jgi:hypothetical protein
VRNPVWDPDPGASDVDDSGARPTQQRHSSFYQVDGMWSALTGVLGGALGGVAMIAAAEGISRWRHFGIDYVGLAGSAARQFPGFTGDATSGALFAAFTGAMLGGGIGWLARRATRVLPRLIFFSILMPALWVLLQAFVIQPLSPWMRTVPALPLLGGALVYGLFLTFALPIVRKRELPPTKPAFS